MDTSCRRRNIQRNGWPFRPPCSGSRAVPIGAGFGSPQRPDVWSRVGGVAAGIQGGAQVRELLTQLLLRSIRVHAHVLDRGGDGALNGGLDGGDEACLELSGGIRRLLPKRVVDRLPLHGEALHDLVVALLLSGPQASMVGIRVIQGRDLEL